MKQAILAVSFGTTHDETREKTIGAVERTFSEAYPEIPVYRAFTSEKVIRALASRGITVDTVAEALEKLLADGVEEVIVQPTHIINGTEFDYMESDVFMYADNFYSVKTGTPLLSSDEDMLAAAKAVVEGVKLENGETLVLMGHGSEHSENAVYSKMNEIFGKLSENIMLATVEAKPDINDCISRLKADGAKKVLLAPFMLVAGEHAQNDMNVSWRALFEQNGIETRTVMRGLGEYEGIRQIYLRHLKAAMEG